MSLDPEAFLKTFHLEAAEQLDQLEELLVATDQRAPTREDFDSLYRSAHSIKGGAGMVGLTVVMELTHEAEGVLSQLREGTLPWTEAVANALLACVDRLRALLSGDKEEARELQARMAAFGRSAASDDAAGLRIWNIRFTPHAELLESGNDPARLFIELSNLGKTRVSVDSSRMPALDQFAPTKAYLAWTIRLESACKESDIAEVFDWVSELCDLEITELKDGDSKPNEGAASEGVPAVAASNPAQAGVTAAPTPATAPPAKEEAKPAQVGSAASNASPASKAAAPDTQPKPPKAPAKPGNERAAKPKAKAKAESSSIRVDTGKIDNLINMVGELVITTAMLGQAQSEVADLKLTRLQDGLAQLDRHVREIQESVMRIRMLPVAVTFNRFPRVVRDLSQQLGKKVELKVSGEGTELDKTVLEQIADPLVHLLRNSIDHGIEMPDDREAMGKPRSGTVELNAFHQSGNIVIEIRDDGKGIDPDILLASALKKGIVRPDDNLSRERILELIFNPGFSMAKEVTDVSGRGVGMDVVRRNIANLGGNIEIETEVGKGTCFLVRLPLTLAILDGQSVRVGNQTFIFPLVSIVESIQVTPDLIRQLSGGREVFCLRGTYLPLLRLHELFDFQEAEVVAEDGLVVVVEVNGHSYGVLVNELLGHQQIVIKSLEANFRKIEGLAGATILGDGKVALIIDAASLLDFALSKNSSALELVSQEA